VLSSNAILEESVVNETTNRLVARGCQVVALAKPAKSVCPQGARLTSAPSVPPDQRNLTPFFAPAFFGENTVGNTDEARS
jgi:hypothetical protein